MSNPERHTAAAGQTGNEFAAATIDELIMDLAQTEYQLRYPAQDHPDGPTVTMLAERERAIVAELRDRGAPFTTARLHTGSAVRRSVEDKSSARCADVPAEVLS